MDKIILITCALLLTGCSWLITEDALRLTSDKGLCVESTSILISDEKKALIYDEISRRGIQCDAPGAIGLRFNPTPESLQMMQMGADIMNKSQPQPLYVPPPTAPIRCQTYQVGNTYQTVCR